MSNLRNKKSAFTIAANKALKNRPQKLTSQKVSITTYRRDGRPGIATIYVKLKYKKRVYSISTGIQCTYDLYDSTTWTVKEDPEATMQLLDLKAKLNATVSDFRLTNRPIDLDLIWRVANGESLEDTTPGLSGCLDIFLDFQKQRLEAGEIQKNRLFKLTGWHRRIREFATYRFGKKSVQLDDIVAADAHSFLLWLKNSCKYEHNSASPIVFHFKSIMDFALENEWVGRNPFMNFKKKLEKKAIIHLTEKEVERLRNHDLFSPVMDHIRRVFLFQCMTGLGYADVIALTVRDILQDEKTGYEYIRIKRKKTGVESIIPLTDDARQIIDSFIDHPARELYGTLIPLISNQKYNNYLKQLAGVVGIQKRLTTHVARRTAASLYVNKGMSMDSVAKMLGHTNAKTTRDAYAQINPERVIRDLSAITKLSKAQ